MSTAQVNNIVQSGGSDTSNSVVTPFEDSAKLISLYAGGGGAISGTAAPFYKNGVAYQVPAGKSFRVVRVICSAPTQAIFQLLSDTVAFAYAAALGSLTAPVYQAGAAARYVGVSDPVAYVPKGVSVGYIFTQNTFPGIEGNAPGSTAVTVLGVEE